MIYRIKQFYWAVNSKLDEYDIKFLNKNLNSTERKLFYNLSKDEQKHSIKVAYDVKKVSRKLKLDSTFLIKVALLHDIGKIYTKLNIIDKSVIVIADNLSKGKIRKFSKIKKIDVYYNHASMGYDILKKLNYTDKLLFLVKNHHNKKINDNLELNILKYYDDRN